MQKVFNNNMMAIVAVMLLIGFSAFKSSENSNRASYWYSIEKIDPLLSETPDNMRITEYLLGFTPPNSSATNCALSNTGNLCHFGADIVTLSPEDLEGLTVEEALALSEVSNDNYSKLP